MSIESLYNSVFSLYSFEQGARDAIGGVTRVLALKQANIPCYVTYLTGQEQYTYGKNNIVADNRLFCGSIEIETTDIVRIIDEDGDNQYNILYIDECDDIQPVHHLEIDLLLIKAPYEIMESSSSSSYMESSGSSSSSSEKYSTSSASSSSTSSSSSSSG